MLDLTSFRSAVTQLKTSLGYVNSKSAKDDLALGEQFRAASIQAFEFTYELSWKMLKRHLEMTEANPALIDELSFQDLIRIGNERGLLLSNWEIWKIYRTARGTTSHTYNHSKAIEVAALIPNFLKEAQFLLDKLANIHNA